jgi:AAA domain
LLIQGPPGTGKTETITGIISLLLHLKNKSCKVQVCAPSNCAVDEILSRIKDRGLVGITDDVEELKKLVVRVGAPEYEPADQIKEFTLQAQCEAIVIKEKVDKLNHQLNYCNQLRALVEKGLLYGDDDHGSSEPLELLPEHSKILTFAFDSNVVDADLFMEMSFERQMTKLSKIMQLVSLEIKLI